MFNFMVVVVVFVFVFVCNELGVKIANICIIYTSNKYVLLFIFFYLYIVIYQLIYQSDSPVVVLLPISP